MAETDFSDKAQILAELWMEYRDEEEYQDFLEYNDLGLPLSYAYVNNIAELTQAGEEMIEETWDMLLGSLGIEEDTGFESFDDLLLVADEDTSEGVEDTSGAEEALKMNESLSHSYQTGFTDGAQAEQKRVQEVIGMHKRWAKEKNRASEFMFWDSAGEVLTPINFEYSEEKYYEDLRNEGF